MDKIKDAFLRLLRAGQTVDKLRRVYATVGLKTDDLFEVFNNIHDGLCILTGEESNEYGDTSVYLALTGNGWSERERLAMLIRAYLKNKTMNEYDEQILDVVEQPKPRIIDRDEMKKQAEAGCGYMAKRGDDG